MNRIAHYLAVPLCLLMFACGGGGGGNSNPSPVNQAPVANAATDQTVIEGVLVLLDGSGSIDTDGSIVSHQWAQSSGSPVVTIANANVANASFTAPAVTTQTQLTFQLTVTDNNGASSNDSVIVTIMPDLPPVAVAPSDFSAVQFSNVTLDGSASSDDKEIVSYQWQQIAGDIVTLSNANSVMASFTAPAFNPSQATILTFQLTVTDGTGETSTDTIAVTIVDVLPIITLSGKITFDRVPLGASNNGLVHAETTIENLRGVTVELLNGAGSSILDNTNSDENGDYSFEVSPDSSYKVRVKAEYLRTGAAPNWNFSIVDNTNGDAIYAMDSLVQAVQSQSVVLNLHAASGWTGAGYGEPRVAAPFAILDSVYQAVQKVLSADPVADFASLKLYWSVSNINANGNDANECVNYDSGLIGTSFYTSQPDCSGIYVLGDANSDTDEFDDHVIVHEWGHYFEDKFSRSDSIGGAHGLSDKLDMRVALGEGFGDAFSAIVTDNPFYRDSFGTNQSQSFGFNIETNPSTGKGWYSEDSVYSLLYDLYDANDDGSDNVTLGFTPIYNALVNGEKNTEALTSIFSLAYQIKLEAPASVALIDALLTSQSVIADDDFASTESNDGGDVRNLPIYKPISVGGASVSVCSFGSNGQYNMLGNRQFLVFDIASSGSYQFTAVGQSAGDDPDIVAYNKGNVAFTSEVVGNESSTQSLSAGKYILEVYDYSNIDTNASPKDTCIDITIN